MTKPRRAYYLVVAVEGSVSWAQTETEVVYDGETFVIKPGSESLHRTVSVELRDQSQLGWEEGRQKVRRFLSALAWAEQGSIRELHTAGGGKGLEIGRNPLPGSVYAGPWRADYLPVPTTTKAKQALAFYREAAGLQNISAPYSFLGFAKVLNLTLGPSKKQVAWINAALPKLHKHYHFAHQRLRELGLVTPDVGDYLYHLGRCAVAHANTLTVNPDDAGDTFRIENDLPLMRALAEHFIETELRIKTHRTIYEEHLYELDGFRQIFEPVMSELKAGGTPTTGTQFSVPNLSLHVGLLLQRPTTANPTFDDLSVEGVGFETGVAVLACSSQDKRVRLLVGLDFKSERLLFDPEDGMAIADDGSAEAIEHESRRLRFLDDMLGNGRTQIYNASSGQLLGRTDPCIPVNIDLGRTSKAIEERIRQLEKVATGRKAQSNEEM
jgi:Methylamine utilization protein MauJ